MNVILTEPLRQAERILEAGTRLDLPEPKALKLVELGYALEIASPEALSFREEIPVLPSSPQTIQPRYSRGGRIKFFGRSSRDILEGEIIMISRPAPDGTPWYQVRGRNQIVFVSQNHIVGEIT